MYYPLTIEDLGPSNSKNLVDDLMRILFKNNLSPRILYLNSLNT